MCGFAGILNLRTAADRPPEVPVLQKMASQIMHRGPDAAGHYADDELGFAHQRLSIIDIATGGQPMLSRDDDVVLVFNGEVFNFIELRRELERDGVVFRTKSDTEVVLELYLARGVGFVSKINGQFSIAIWDKRSRELHLIRDRIGICPLFYTVDNGRLIFGSEIKAMIPALSSRPSISLESLNQVFTFWAALSPNTIFEGIKEISPGHILTVSDGRVSHRQYWEWPVPTDGYSDRQESSLADQLHELLVDATQIRLRSDVPVGAYLSGGLDSSAIVSLILNHTTTDLRTFSLTFDDRAFDESGYQETLVNHARVCHSSLSVDNAEVGRNLRRTVWHAEAPILRTAPVPMGMLSGHVRDSGFKVVLTGEGADEVLGGYDIFKEAKVRQFWARQAGSKFRPLLLKRLYPYLALPKGKDAEYLKSFFGMGIDNPGDLGFSHLPRWVTTAKAKAFLSREAMSAMKQNVVAEYAHALPSQLSQTDSFNRAQYIESKTMMSGYLLCSQGDRMLMMNSVEGRFPFLDHRVIEFSSKLNPALKMKVLNEKYLLKKAVGKYLPRSIVERHKQPYRAPDVLGIGTDKADESISDSLRPENLAKSGLFDQKKVALLQKKAAKRGRLSTSESQAICGIITTQLVHEQFC